MSCRECKVHLWAALLLQLLNIEGSVNGHSLTTGEAYNGIVGEGLGGEGGVL